MEVIVAPNKKSVWFIEQTLGFMSWLVNQSYEQFRKSWANFEWLQKHPGLRLNDKPKLHIFKTPIYGTQWQGSALSQRFWRWF